MTRTDYALPRRPMRLPVLGLAAVLTAILFLSGAIHIVTILSVPSLASADGWSRLSDFAGEEQFSEIPKTAGTGRAVAGLDPLFVNGACHISVSEVPTAITVEPSDRFWSLALYDPYGMIVFSLNDRTVVDGRLDMLIVDARQNRASPAPASEEAPDTIVVEAKSSELIAVLRLFAPTPGTIKDARRILARSECLPAPAE